MMRTQSSIEDDIRLAQEGFEEFAARTGIKRNQVVKRRRPALLPVTVFLSLAVFALTGVLLYTSRSVGTEWVKVSTSFAQTKVVSLPDGSRVKISPCSQIIYPEKFARHSREVMLVGEAFFDVSKDAKRKFTVSAGSMEVVVHGTQFNVSSYLSDEEDEVALVEGSVEMRFHGDPTSILLKPGEMVKYDKVNNVTERRSFAANCFKDAISSNGLQFNNERLVDIVATLNRRFDTNIIVENETLKSTRYFASFINGEGVDQILSALDVNGDFRIVRKGNIIFIN